MEDAAAGAASPAGGDRPAGGRVATAADAPADGDRDFVLEDGEDMDEGEDGEAAVQEEDEARDGPPAHTPPPAADGDGEGSYESGGSSPGSPSMADSDLDAEVEMEDDEEEDDDDVDDGSGQGEEEDAPAGRHGATAAKVPAASRPAAAAGGEPPGGDYPLSDGADDEGDAVEVRKPRRQRAPIVIPPDLLRRSTRARAEVRRYTITPPTSAEPSSADASDDDDFQAGENGKPTGSICPLGGRGGEGGGGPPLYVPCISEWLWLSLWLWSCVCVLVWLLARDGHPDRPRAGLVLTPRSFPPLSPCHCLCMHAFFLDLHPCRTSCLALSVPPPQRAAYWGFNLCVCLSFPCIFIRATGVCVVEPCFVPPLCRQ